MSLTKIDIPGWLPAFLWTGLPSTSGWHRPRYKLCNKQFLGKHQTAMYGQYSGRIYGKLPRSLKCHAMQMIADSRPLIGEQHWTTAFVGKFSVGDYVTRHRDPHSNKDYTLIYVQGEFTGATTTIYTNESPVVIELKSNSMLALPCTTCGRRGPAHEVSPVLSGVRHTLILNTVA